MWLICHLRTQAEKAATWGDYTRGVFGAVSVVQCVLEYAQTYTVNFASQEHNVFLVRYRLGPFTTGTNKIHTVLILYLRLERARSLSLR
jgi:hypothetical protein